MVGGEEKPNHQPGAYDPEQVVSFLGGDGVKHLGPVVWYPQGGQRMSRENKRIPVVEDNRRQL